MSGPPFARRIDLDRRVASIRSDGHIVTAEALPIPIDVPMVGSKAFGLVPLSFDFRFDGGVEASQFIINVICGVVGECLVAPGVNDDLAIGVAGGVRSGAESSSCDNDGGSVPWLLCGLANAVGSARSQCLSGDMGAFVSWPSEQQSKDEGDEIDVGGVLGSDGCLSFQPRRLTLASNTRVDKRVSGNVCVAGFNSSVMHVGEVGGLCSSGECG